MRRPRLGSALALVAMVAVVGALAYYFISQSSEENGDEPGGGGGYRPKHRLGAGPDDFWTVYPAGHVSAGRTVPFPSWVQQESASKVLLVLAHTEGCAPCLQQQKDVRAVMSDATFAASVNYLDLLADGSDARAQDCFSLLDPEGMQNYIPLTVIVARDPYGAYFWHSWEGVTGKANLEGWLRDAMYYQTSGVGA
ncbi:MAG: hypothetical protein ACUVV6_06145 [Thermoplasmatota archaeon]